MITLAISITLYVLGIMFFYGFFRGAKFEAPLMAAYCWPVMIVMIVVVWACIWITAALRHLVLDVVVKYGFALGNKWRYWFE